jgi:AcrR family transcriptional regulator
MPHRIRPPRRKDAIATRARLVRAALDLFTADGYRGTTTLDLADRARTAEATIYRHFTGKESLYNEALREALRFGVGLVREGERAAAGAGAAKGRSGDGCRARLARIAGGLVDRAAEDPALVLMLLRRPSGPPLDDVNLQLTREFRDGLAQAIAGGKQEGSVRAGSAELWSAVWLALATFAVERVTSREWSPGHPNVAQTLEAAWNAIAYRAGAAERGVPG